ncbi:MAG: multicopper oxidase family protein [Deltaproteobacteria bacterium]|nr:multicopper oxidase family protein [Deltaproteobacteria bacterium]MBI3390149.1 multicopper oxidase family protein [Deltaproteobacteria bacterium]
MELTRRDVLKLAGGAIVASYVPAVAIERSPVGYLSYLPIRRLQPGRAEAELIAMPALASVAGTTANLWTYNGTFPGPVLVVREGERVRVRFRNRLSEPTNVHWHGLHIPPSVDDPFLMVAPGETVDYEFVIPNGSAGTYWYHPHVHGRVAQQLFAGLAGAVVVKGPMDYSRELRRAEEYTLVFKDITLAAGGVAAHTPFDWMNGKEGELLLVNGALQPTLSPRRSLLRLRLLNASNARYYRLSLEGHDLHLIATDGGLLAAPVAVPELLLAPGERSEVLVQLQGVGEFRLLNLPYDRGTAMMGGMHRNAGRGTLATTQTLLTISSSGVARPTLPRRLCVVEALAPGAASVRRRLVLSEGMMMGTGFFINGKTFDPSRTDIAGRLGDVELWEIENRGRMDHPFHLHTYPFQVLSRNGVPEPFVAWKDVVNVRAGEIVRLAVALRDFVGRTVFHCHIVEHEDRGMMGVLAV